jgi:hypothetical protein
MRGHRIELRYSVIGKVGVIDDFITAVNNPLRISNEL